ncbi:MAG: formylglycine-generating enzyme family protein [bacterium]
MRSRKAKFTFLILILAILLGLGAWAVRAAPASDRKIITNSKDGSELILIPAGEFIMGAPDEEGYDNEHPRHRVNLSAYYIGKYEVTNKQFAKFVQETGFNAQGNWKGCYNPKTADHPVVSVTWNDAEAYCDWAGLRLPTEAEWEKAARGTEDRKYPWGDKWDVKRCNSRNGPKLSGMANMGCGRGTLPVGSFPSGASPYGCLDMAGNVWEWCSDWYDADYYLSLHSSDPQGSGSGRDRVLRGGSWLNADPGCLRTANRNRNAPDDWVNFVGFRAARDVP